MVILMLLIQDVNKKLYLFYILQCVTLTVLIKKKLQFSKTVKIAEHKKKELIWWHCKATLQ
jgi:hypothetical protein